MPPRDWRDRIKDILEAVRRIRDYTEGMDLQSFKADPRTVDAVLRNLEVIGEAARHVPDEIKQRHPPVPWSEMRGIRNVIAHAYFGVDLTIILKTVSRSLPALAEPLQTVLRADDSR